MMIENLHFSSYNIIILHSISYVNTIKNEQIYFFAVIDRLKQVCADRHIGSQLLMLTHR